MKSYYLEGAETLTLKDIDVPEPAKGQVRVKVERVGICGSDVHYYSHGYCGAFVPKEPFALGHEFAGIIDAVGTA